MIKGKYSLVYLFLMVFLLISFATGFVYYHVQSAEEKTNLVESFDLETNMSYRKNSILPSLYKCVLVLICSILIVPNIVSVFVLFYDTFSIAFVFHLLFSINGRIAFLYSFCYYIIPLLFYIWLLRIGFSISHSILSFFISKRIRDKKRLILLLKKFLLVSLFLLCYQVFIYIFSIPINEWILTFIK